MLLLFATPVTSPFFPFSRLDRLAQVAVVLIKSCATCLELSPKVFVSNPIIDLLPFARSLTLRPRKGPARIGQRSSYIVRSAAAARNGSDPCQILQGLPVAGEVQASRCRPKDSKQADSAVNVVEVRASANRGQRLQSVLITQFGSSCWSRCAGV